MFLPFSNSNYVVSTQRVSKIILSNEPDDEMALSEHIEEFSQRLIFCFGVLALITIACFTDIKEIVRIFQAPAIGIKFLQFAPGEYFFASIKIAAFCGILFSSPIILYQIFLYVVPGMTKKERNIIVPGTLAAIILFGVGILFFVFFLSTSSIKVFYCLRFGRS